MSPSKTVTLQLDKRRRRLKQELVARQQALERARKDPTFTQVETTGNCASCGDGFVEDCPGCEETFDSRNIPADGGWGTSELSGEPWLTIIDGTNFFVNAGSGIAVNPQSNSYAWTDIPLLFPFEILYEQILFDTGSPPTIGASWEFATSVFASTQFQVGFNVSQTIDPNYLKLSAVSDTHAATYTVFSSQADWSFRTMMLRFKATDSTLYAKAWPKWVDENADVFVASEEPSTWQIVIPKGGALPNGMRLRLSSGSAEPWSWFVQNIEVVEGCNPPGPCEQDIIDQGGAVLAYVEENQVASDGGIVGLVILGICRRVDSTTYLLPSNATRIQSVQLDSIRLSGWSFAPPRTLNFPHSVDPDTKVYARYYVT